MRILRIGPVGQERPVVAFETSAGEEYRDLSTVTQDIDAAFWLDGGVKKIQQALADEALSRIELDVTTNSSGESGERVGAPIARPGNIICIGMNYAAHAAESGSEPPKVPVVFFKPSNTLAGPFDAAPIPPLSEKYDWEVELGVVLGARLSYAASPEEAKAAIGGYLVANDLSEREYQIPGDAGQWTKGKSLPFSTPVGPWLVPADEIDSSSLRLRSWVNGDPRQDSVTSDLIFDVPTVLHHLSQYMLLEPGDLVLTGTPEGVALSGRFPYLKPGDVAELEIEGLGRMRHEFYRTQTN